GLRARGSAGREEERGEDREETRREEDGRRERGESGRDAPFHRSAARSSAEGWPSGPNVRSGRVVALATSLSWQWPPCHSSSPRTSASRKPRRSAYLSCAPSFFASG